MDADFWEDWSAGLPDGFQLSVVDQSPVRKGGTAADALKESVRLAQIVEGLGYSRYWVAEHHNSGAFAGTSPEILIGQIAGATNSIRVGSGGVMLSHYSSLKVAEQFRVLDSFFPGRIDLGIGRAPGSDRLTSAALVYPRPQADINKFPQQVSDLMGYLTGAVVGEQAFSGIRAQPGSDPESTPEVWLLGSSFYSAQLAAVLGLPFSFADFFGMTSFHGPEAASVYRREFQPSPYVSEPKLNVTLQVICAATTEEAEYLATSRKIDRLRMALGERQGLLPPEEAAAYSLREDERIYIERNTVGNIVGDPDQVGELIVQAAARYDTVDVGIVTNCYDFQARVTSYELVAERFNLQGPEPATMPSEQLAR